MINPILSLQFHLWISFSSRQNAVMHKMQITNSPIPTISVFSSYRELRPGGTFSDEVGTNCNVVGVICPPDWNKVNVREMMMWGQILNVQTTTLMWCKSKRVGLVLLKGWRSEQVCYMSWNTQKLFDAMISISIIFRTCVMMIMQEQELSIRMSKMKPK